jgi:hypothetical protein
MCLSFSFSYLHCMKSTYKHDESPEEKLYSEFIGGEFLRVFAEHAFLDLAILSFKLCSDGSKLRNRNGSKFSVGCGYVL